MDQTIAPLGRRGFRLAGYPSHRRVAPAGGGQPNVDERAPGPPGVPRSFAPATWLARVNVHLAVASIPVLAISAHVFWLVSLRTVALFVLLPLVAALALFIVTRPDTVPIAWCWPGSCGASSLAPAPRHRLLGTGS
jgi:hypothetical protein